MWRHHTGPYGTGTVSSAGYQTRRARVYSDTWPCPGSKNFLNSSGWLVTNAGVGGCRLYSGGDTAGCTTSADCRIPPMQSAYCSFNGGNGKGTCVQGGGTVFDGPALLGFDNFTFSEMQAGVLGGYLRVASVGAYDVESGRGLEMMALGPLKVNGSYASDYDTLFVAIRPHTSTNTTTTTTTTTNANISTGNSATATTTTTSAQFQYYQASLDRRYSQAAKPVGADVFYSRVLQHAVEWNAAFAPGMQVTLYETQYPPPF